LDWHQTTNDTFNYICVFLHAVVECLYLCIPACCSWMFIFVYSCMLLLNVYICVFLHDVVECLYLCMTACWFYWFKIQRLDCHQTTNDTFNYSMQEYTNINIQLQHEYTNINIQLQHAGIHKYYYIFFIINNLNVYICVFLHAVVECLYLCIPACCSWMFIFVTFNYSMNTQI
jgi:hypothetical protein